MKQQFLPICRQDMIDRGWEQVDFVYVSGDAYVDHPSFGHAIITQRYWKLLVTKSGSLHSRTGKIKTV